MKRFATSPAVVLVSGQGCKMYAEICKMCKKKDAKSRCLVLFLIFSASLISLTLFTSIAAAEETVSMGVSPGNILVFSNVLHGGYAEQIITVSTARESAIGVQIFAEGPIKNWLSFVPKSGSLTVSRSAPLEIRVIAQPSADTPNGIYNGTIKIRGTPAGEAPVGVISSAITAGVALQTSVEIIGEQILNYDVLSIIIKDTEVGYPLEISVKIANNGNVKAIPKITAAILDENKSSVLKTVNAEDAEILPSMTADVPVKVSTDALEAGRYWARVTVYKGAEMLAQQEKIFNIFEKGTLHITGELLQIWNKAWASVGEPVKIMAIFENTGQLTVSAQFKGEVYFSGALVKTLVSDELDVGVGEKANLTVYFTPEENGRYVARGYVTYGKKTTEIKESVINVLSNEATPLGFGALAVASLVLLLAVFVFKLWRRRERQWSYPTS